MSPAIPYLMPAFIIFSLVLILWGIYILYLITMALRIYIKERCIKKG